MTVTRPQDAILVGDGEESLSIGRLALRLRLRKHAIHTIKNKLHIPEMTVAESYCEISSRW